MRLLLRVGIGGTAMFAEPTVTEIEEMVCLVHGRKRRKNSGGRIQKTEVRIQQLMGRDLPTSVF
jgi:hypothetical protein